MFFPDTAGSKLDSTYSITVDICLGGLFCGIIVWVIIDPFQTHELGGYFQDDLENRLEIRAADTRSRFEYFLTGFGEGHMILLKTGVWSDMSTPRIGSRAGKRSIIYFNEPRPWMMQGFHCAARWNPVMCFYWIWMATPGRSTINGPSFPIDLALRTL